MTNAGDFFKRETWKLIILLTNGQHVPDEKACVLCRVFWCCFEFSFFKMHFYAYNLWRTVFNPHFIKNYLSYHPTFYFLISSLTRIFRPECWGLWGRALGILRKALTLSTKHKVLSRRAAPRPHFCKRNSYKWLLHCFAAYCIISIVSIKILFKFSDDVTLARNVFLWVHEITWRKLLFPEIYLFKSWKIHLWVLAKIELL